jgi:hypothetical protein
LDDTIIGTSIDARRAITETLMETARPLGGNSRRYRDYTRTATARRRDIHFFEDDLRWRKANAVLVSVWATLVLVRLLSEHRVSDGSPPSEAPDDQMGARPSRRGRWPTIGLLLAAAILSYTDRQILSLLVYPITGDLGISDLQIGIMQGMAFAFVYVFSGLPAGHLAHTRGRRGILLTGLAIRSLATIGCGLAAGIGSFVAARIFVGIGEAALASATTSIIADLFPLRERGRALAALVAGMNVSSGLAIVIGGSPRWHSSEHIE